MVLKTNEIPIPFKRDLKAPSPKWVSYPYYLHLVHEVNDRSWKSRWALKHEALPVNIASTTTAE